MAQRSWPATRRKVHKIGSEFAVLNDAELAELAAGTGELPTRGEKRAAMALVKTLMYLHLAKTLDPGEDRFAIVASIRPGDLGATKALFDPLIAKAGGGMSHFPLLAKRPDAVALTADAWASLFSFAAIPSTSTEEGSSAVAFDAHVAADGSSVDARLVPDMGIFAAFEQSLSGLAGVHSDPLIFELFFALALFDKGLDELVLRDRRLDPATKRWVLNFSAELAREYPPGLWEELREYCAKHPELDTARGSLLRDPAATRDYYDLVLEHTNPLEHQAAAAEGMLMLDEDEDDPEQDDVAPLPADYASAIPLADRRRAWTREWRVLFEAMTFAFSSLA